MTATSKLLDELEARLEGGAPFAHADAELLLSASDLVRIGILGDTARRRRSGDVVTFGRVLTLTGDRLPASRGNAGEVRIAGVHASADAMLQVVRTAAGLAEGVPLMGFDLADLAGVCGQDHLAIADLARALASHGLDGVAALSVDRVGSVEEGCEVVRAARHGGLSVLRLVVSDGSVASCLDLAERVAALQRECGGFRAFAPLSRQTPADMPSTGYDDVKAIALARLVCADIERIQVDWPLYGPKLAQVALTFGANDVDGVSAFDDPTLGSRRAAAEDIRRQIRDASSSASERDGLYRSRE